MKKSTIILLLIVFLGSVIIVGVFGMQAIPIDSRVYVTDIIPTSVVTIDGQSLEIKKGESADYYYVMLPYEEGLTVIISTRIEPVDSTNKELTITIDNNKEDNPLAKIGEKGEILILRRGTVRLHYSSKDSATFKGMDFRIYTY
ncbi:MAG: hypothetical protein J1F68_01705 [Clostridiales bacterium]|nr:hypothetical protein [Clostridiales bacterium]